MKRLAYLAPLALLLALAPLSPSTSAPPAMAAEVRASLPVIANALDVSVDEVALRVQQRTAALPLIHAVMGDRDHFGQIVYDNTAHKYTVFVAGPVAQGLALVGDKVPAGVPVDFVPVQYSTAQLEDAATAAEGALARDFGDHLYTIGMDARSNTVRITTDGTLTAAELEPYLGVAVTVEKGERPQAAACYSRTNCPAWRAGIGISEDSVSCCFTAGPWGKNNTNHWMLLTAGHAGLGVDIYHNGDWIGHINRTSFDCCYTLDPINNYKHVDTDSARIKLDTVDDTDNSLPMDCAYKYDTYKCWDFTDTMGYSDLSPGTDVCKIGLGGPNNGQSAVQCGTISTPSVSIFLDDFYNGETFWLDKQAYMEDINVWAGDSGAVMFGVDNTGHKYAGTASVYAGSHRVYFSRVNLTLDDMKWQCIYLTTGC